MAVTLDWLGCATFRLTAGDLVIFLDAYIDRVSSAPLVGLTAAEVTRADYVLVGHSHFDHIAGAEVIAPRTGAKVIGSNETARVLREAGVAEGQLLAAQGGERFRLSPEVTVRVFPSLHSCIWVGGSWDVAKVVTGHYGLTEAERAAVRAETGGGIGERARGAGAGDPEEMREHMRGTIGSRETGGALAFLIETPDGSVFYHDTSGVWTGVASTLRPDVAIVAMAGRPNIDGEPIQGSLAQFVGRMADLLRPRRLVLGHHDNWMPPMTTDMATPEAMAAVREELGRVAPRVELLALGFNDGTRILG
ncbi:MAG: MBL fold metallo-hydrolase [Chloroflexi bacterium]|nr:MBL fold metallo-hydrolase [Chloroflexota bacterium]